MKRMHIAAYLIVGLLVSNMSFGALVAHFDGSQITTTNGNQVAQWSNQGSGKHAKGLGDLATYPTASSVTMPNGTTHTVVGFDGVGNHLTMGSDTNNYDGDAFTWIIVFKNGNTDQNGKSLLASTYDYTYGGTVTSGNNPVWQTFANSGNNVYVAARSSTGGFAGKGTGTGTSDEWHIMIGKWNGSGRLYAWLDGSYLGYTSSATADPTGHVRTRIGSNSNGTAGSFFNGQIAEIQIFNESLSDPVRTAIEDELMIKYIVVDPALVAHYDGAHVATTGGLVDRWNNQGVGGDATASGDFRPLAISVAMPNGTTHTVLDFNGTTNALVVGSDGANYDTNTFTWFVVVKSDDYSSARVIHKHSYTGGATQNANAMWGDFHSDNGKIYSHSRTSTGEFKSRSVLATDGEWHLVVAAWDGNTGQLRAWHDGVYDGGTTTGVDANPTGHQRTRIGADAASGSPSSFFDGQIAEIRIYNTSMIELEDTKRLAIEDELLAKYFGVVTPLDLYNAWAGIYNLSNEFAAMESDPDGDLLINLGEYAFGGDPNNPADIGYGSTGGTVLDGGTNWLEFVYPKRLDANFRGLEYLPEATGDLVVEGWSANGVSTVGTGVLDAEFLSVTSRVSAVSDDEKFMHLRVDFQE